ncbi:MAG: hypothetical protein L3K07_03390 [Thermoplasmata archaeon]|nr:hypothetical protein [Thermoplasmata archaeon]
MSFGPDPPGAALPSVGRRVTLGLFRVFPLLILLVGIPAAILGYLAGAGVQAGTSVYTVSVGGLALTALSTARYIMRPTAAFGPVGLLRAGAAFAYLWFLRPTASVLVPAGAHVTLALDYSTVVEALFVIPLLLFVTAVLVTIQDHRNLAARLRVDFPARLR